MNESATKREITAYGDTVGDGRVQLSFTLPVPNGALAMEAARELLKKMSLEDIDVVHTSAISESLTFCVAYGSCRETVDLDTLDVVEQVEDVMEMKEVDEYITGTIGHKLVVVGACIGSDAHTVGIDAILNMKGYDHDYGLERYKMFETYNMGAQVPPEEMIKKGVEVNADCLLVSQVVTQKDIHVRQMTQLVELLEAEGVREKFLLVCGGPAIDARLAQELGFDAGFGRGTRPSYVATYIARTLAARKEILNR